MSGNGVSRSFKGNIQSIVVQAHNFPLVESLPTCSLDDIDTYPDNIPKEALEGTALMIQDWHKAQADDRNIAYIVKCLSAKSKPSRQEIDRKNIDNRYKAEWERYRLKSGILYRTYQVEDEEFHQLVLPESLRDIIFKSYHDDLGHQGRDRTLTLIKQRFYCPGMTQFVQSKVQQCVKCIRRKTRPTKAAELVNITSGTPMELVCIDYLSLERSKGGYENILVITDNFMLKQFQQGTKQLGLQQECCMKTSSSITVSQQNYTVIRGLTLRARSLRSSVR